MSSFRLAETEEGEVVVCRQVKRKNKVTQAYETRWLPIVPIEELDNTFQQHYDGSMGINTLYDQVCLV